MIDALPEEYELEFRMTHNEHLYNQMFTCVEDDYVVGYVPVVSKEPLTLYWDNTSWVMLNYDNTLFALSKYTKGNHVNLRYSLINGFRTISITEDDFLKIRAGKTVHWNQIGPTEFSIKIDE